MKNRTKKAVRAAILMLLCVAFILPSCGEKDYNTDVDTKELADTLRARTQIESAWVNEDQSFLTEYFQMPDYVRESQVYYAQNTNELDEFGIFEVEKGHAQELRSLLANSYLQKRYSDNLEWYNSYMPTETPKLRDAEVRVYGNYVAYAVLSPEHRTAFFSECERLLKNEE